MTADEREQERYESLNPARFEDESYEDYKIRRRITNRLLRNYLKGRQVI